MPTNAELAAQVAELQAALDAASPVPAETRSVAEQLEGDDYKCYRCGSTYSTAIVEGWGTNGVGDGYGPVPNCITLVPVKGDRIGALQSCRGPLVPNL